MPVAVKARRKRTRRPQLWASERMVRGMGYAVVSSTLTHSARKDSFSITKSSSGRL